MAAVQRWFTGEALMELLTHGPRFLEDGGMEALFILLGKEALGADPEEGKTDDGEEQQGQPDLGTDAQVQR